jgi:hypothetical protein
VKKFGTLKTRKSEIEIYQEVMLIINLRKVHESKMIDKNEPRWSMFFFCKIELIHVKSYTTVVLAKFSHSI